MGETGAFLGLDGEQAAVLRRIDLTPWWSRIVARHFLRREARALGLAGPLGIAPRLLHAGSDTLVRSWIDGAALHVARPLNDRMYFRSALAALQQLHRAGVCHNDLAKPQNWLRGRDGRAYLTDFQLAWRFRRRGWAFRLAAYEDLMMRYWELAEADRDQIVRLSRHLTGERATGRRWIGRIDGRPVAKGYLSLAGPPGVGAIYGMSVLPEARGRGIAGALTDILVEHAAALGCRRVVLHSSAMAEGVYRRAGFAPCCDLAIHATAAIWSGDH